MKIWNNCRKAGYVILFAAVISMSAYIFYGAVDTLKYADALENVINGRTVPMVMSGTVLLLAIFAVAILTKVLPVMEKRFSKTVVVLGSLIVLVQILTVLVLRTSFRQDHLKIFDTAVALLEYPTIAETHFSQYFMKYPNNIPMCIFTYGWLKLASLFGIPESSWMDFMKIINVVFMNLGMWAAFDLIRRHRSKKTALCFLLFLIVNPLWYLLAEMYYTSTISLAFSMGGIWLFDRAGEERDMVRKLLQYVGMGLLLAAGYKIRATVILTILSLLVYTVFTLDEEKITEWKKRIVSWGLSLAAVLFGLLLVFTVYGRAEQRYAGFDPAKTGYPTVHWIMMSAQGEGQYNSADDAFTGSFDTKAERTAADFAELRHRVGEMGPGGLLTLFRNKLRVAFSDGTDDYYALFRTMQSPSRLQKYINGGRSDLLAFYLHSYHGLLMGMVLLALIYRAWKGKPELWDVLIINLCGAYLFYLIWEVDQAYSIPFLLILTALGAEGISLSVEDASRPERELPEFFGWIPAVSGGILLVEVLAVVLVMKVTGLPVRDYAVLQDQETSDQLTLQTDFAQTFRTGKAFDHLDLWVANWDGGANDSVYDVTILDESGAAVATGQVIGAEAPCMSPYTIAFDRVQPDHAETYTIQVAIQNPDCAIKTDFLYYQSTCDLYADGALYTSQEEQKVDLAFAVYSENFSDK